MIDTVTTKVCCRCLMEKPAAAYYVNSSSRDRRKASCKSCDTKSLAARRTIPTAKACEVCEVVKAMDQFPPHPRRRDRRKRYCNACATSKLCNACGVRKPLADFWKNSENTGDKRCAYCKVCASEKKAAWDLTPVGKHYARRHSLKKKYGISLDDYDNLLSNQDGRCAICGDSDPGGGYTNFQVDHCHRAGRVRSLLCIYCNRGLGQFKDDPALLLKAADYLHRHQGAVATCG